MDPRRSEAGCQSDPTERTRTYKEAEQEQPDPEAPGVVCSRAAHLGFALKTWVSWWGRGRGRGRKWVPERPPQRCAPEKPHSLAEANILKFRISDPGEGYGGGKDRIGLILASKAVSSVFV